MNNDYVVVIGGSNIDFVGKSYSEIFPNVSNPGEITKSLGGVGRNIAQNLALLKINVVLLSAVGDDNDGKWLLKETKKIGVDVSKVHIATGQLSGSYIAFNDCYGELINSISDMRIIGEISPKYINDNKEVLENAQIIICDANLSHETLLEIKKIATEANIKLCLDPVSAVKAHKLCNILDGTFLITPNLDELYTIDKVNSSEINYENAFEDAAKYSMDLINKGVLNVVVTLGKKGLCYTNIEGNHTLESIPTIIVDTNGAGDSLTAGLIYGYLKKNNFDYALKTGLAAAAITIGSNSAVSNKLSEDEIDKVLEKGYYNL